MKRIFLIFIVLLISQALPSTLVAMQLPERENILLSGETEYWGVIVGIADYAGFKNDLPVTQRHMRALYETLCSQDNWQEDHLLLLLDEEATKENVLDAFEWLITHSDSDDVVLFSFQGHGSSIDDDTGDELDGKDEGIVAWEGLEGIIIDDQLDEKLDQISCEGMFLIFHSCLSGGLIDTPRCVLKFQSYWSFTPEFTSDIEGDHRVIIMSSMDQGLALAYPSLTRQTAYGLQGDAEDDQPEDPGFGVISAEETARYASAQVKKLFILLFLLYPPGILSFLIASFIAKIRSGYYIRPIPQISDGYLEELPIVYY
jgi:hypothetical protein